VTSPIVRLPLVVIVALLAQLTLIADMRVLAATGDVLLLLAIGAGIAAGPERAAITGFVAGIAFDLVLETPFGLSALTYCIVGYVVGRAQTGILRHAWWVPMITTALASAAGVVLYVALEAVLGDSHLFDMRMLAVVGTVSILNALLSPFVVRAMRWVFVDDALHTVRAWR
jgi:rod shape-determining protein MreD